MSRVARASMVAVVAALAVPASALAIASPVMLDIQTGSNAAGDTVRATCAGGPGVATDFNSGNTHVVTAEATATPNDPANFGIGTTVSCQVKDAITGQLYGAPVSRGLFGPEVVAADKVVVPAGARPKVCVSAWAGFFNGAVATQPAGC